MGVRGMGVRGMMVRRSFLIAAALCACGPALADPASHDEARRALERGEVKPLAEILQRVQPDLGGEVVSVELERKHGAWVYEFRVLGADGRRRDFYVDALTGDIRRIKQKEH